MTCVCVYVYVCVYIYICMYIYIVYIYVCVCVHVRVPVYINNKKIRSQRGVIGMGKCARSHHVTRSRNIHVLEQLNSKIRVH